MGIAEKTVLVNIQTSCFLTAVFTYLHANHPKGFTNAEFNAAVDVVQRMQHAVQEKLF